MVPGLPFSSLLLILRASSWRRSLKETRIPFSGQESQQIEKREKVLVSQISVLWLCFRSPGVKRESGLFFPLQPRTCFLLLRCVDVQEWDRGDKGLALFVVCLFGWRSAASSFFFPPSPARLFALPEHISGESFGRRRREGEWCCLKVVNEER